MASLKISHPTKRAIGRLEVPGSKSESNRLLLLKALYAPGLQIAGLSNSRDSHLMQSALAEEGAEVNVGDAGTAMRFMTAFLATQEGRCTVLRGTERMHQRPIGVLVEALNSLGAGIEYLENEGYPPLLIKGKRLSGGAVQMDSSVSSQFISALMMLGASFERGVQISMKGFSVSTPYLYLTASLMRQFGFQVEMQADQILVLPGQAKKVEKLQVEPDWSAASYWFLVGQLAETAEIYLPAYRQWSMQGDALIQQYYRKLGVESTFTGGGFRLHKSKVNPASSMELNLVQQPDLAQTLAVGAAAAGLNAHFKGLRTLRIKETDRLQALKTELEKCGARIEIGADHLSIERGIQEVSGVAFDTYDDHRMAMALAPLALLGEIQINDPRVVVKSYPNFWEHLKQLGFEIAEN